MYYWHLYYIVDLSLLWSLTLMNVYYKYIFTSLVLWTSPFCSCGAVTSTVLSMYRCSTKTSTVLDNVVHLITIVQFC